MLHWISTFALTKKEEKGNEVLLWMKYYEIFYLQKRIWHFGTDAVGT